MALEDIQIQRHHLFRPDRLAADFHDPVQPEKRRPVRDAVEDEFVGHRVTHSPPVISSTAPLM